MKKPLLCVHIEKTAGTSFKPTVSDHFETVFDYGLRHHWTSQVVLDFWASDQQDPSFFTDRGITAIFGHFLPERYLRKDRDLPVLTWVRDPVQRLLSDYHFKGPQGDLSLTDSVSAQIRAGDLSFNEFIQHPTVSNVLSRYLDKVPEENFVFVGESEQYDSDLKRFGQRYNADVLARPARNRATGNKHQITKEEEALLRHLHSKDFKQYQRILQIKQQLNAKPQPQHKNPPLNHKEVIWQDVDYDHAGNLVQLPRFLRNAWQIRPPEYREKWRQDLKTREDFELWYLFHGINEFSPHSDVFAEIVRRFTDLGDKKKKRKKAKSGIDWLSVIQTYPQVYRSYFLRSDLRKEHPLGSPQGVEAFFRWWDLHGEDSQGKDRQGLSEMARFNWEDVTFKQAGAKAQLPRLLRDIWLRRPDLQTRFPLTSPTFRQDFEIWYLTVGMKESASTAPFDQGLLERNFPAGKNSSKTKASNNAAIDWFYRLKNAPDAFLIYLQRPDLRRDQPIGDLPGVEVFLRWWDREGEKHYGKDRAGMELFHDFDREKVALTDGDNSHEVPRLWRDIWQSRPDLQTAFPLSSPAFRIEFARWYVNSGQYERTQNKP